MLNNTIRVSIIPISTPGFLIRAPIINAVTSNEEFFGGYFAAIAFQAHFAARLFRNKMLRARLQKKAKQTGPYSFLRRLEQSRCTLAATNTHTYYSVFLVTAS